MSGRTPDEETDACPLLDTKPGDWDRHLIWRDEAGWVVAWGTPKAPTPVASGLSCWHEARDTASRRWLVFWNGGPGWSTPSIRAGRPLGLPDGQQVCDVCWGDLTGGAR